MEIIFATKNKGKLREVKAILDNYTVLGMEEAGVCIEIEEDGTTFEENAIKKAVEIHKITGGIVLSDDSGIEIDYLDKQPGVHSARFLGADTPYTVKNAKVLDMLKNAVGDQRSARYVAVIAAAYDGGVITATGLWEGAMAQAAAGENGFGYDPIFLVPRYNLTAAQMEPSLKNKISHRATALRLMKEKLNSIFSSYQ